jgi:hypothetical protein
VLVASGRIESVPVDLVRASAFLQQAEDSLADIDNVRVAQNLYSLAYGAGHAVGEALLAAYGYRTANRAGHHEALVRFLAEVLTDAAGVKAVKHFERMRRARNRLQYEARPPSETDAKAAARTAIALVAAVREQGLR